MTRRHHAGNTKTGIYGIPVRGPSGSGYGHNQLEGGEQTVAVTLAGKARAASIEAALQ
jgi:hypothetical protein